MDEEIQLDLKNLCKAKQCKDGRNFVRERYISCQQEVRKPNSLGTGWDQLWGLNPGDVRNQGVPQRLGQVRPWNLKAFIRPGLGR